MSHIEDQLASLADRLDKSSGIPLYLQLSRGLEALIEQRALKPDDRLPGSVELSRGLGVNIGTVSKAMARLVDKGLIIRRRRAGTFVTDHACGRHGSVGFYYLREREPVSLEELEAMQVALSEDQFDVKLIPFEWDFFKQVDLLEDVRRRGLTGAVFTILPDDACREAMRKLEASDFAHVRLGNRYFENELCSPLVTGDDEGCIRDTFERLRKHGHERIGFLGGPSELAITTAYRQEMTGCPSFRESWRLPLNFDGPLVMDPDRTAAHPIAQLVRGYLHENPELTAVLVWHPVIAEHLARQARQLDRPVPQRLSVIALRDGAPFGIPTPCSAWRMSKRRMGQATAEHLLSIMHGEPTPPNLYLPWQFIDRNSVAPPTALETHIAS